MRCSACNRKREAVCVARFGNIRMIRNDGSLTSMRLLRVGEAELVYASIRPRVWFQSMEFARIAVYRRGLQAVY
jgi:hypothetical protein